MTKRIDQMRPAYAFWVSFDPYKVALISTTVVSLLIVLACLLMIGFNFAPEPLTNATVAVSHLLLVFSLCAAWLFDSMKATILPVSVSLSGTVYGDMNSPKSVESSGSMDPSERQ